MIGIRKRLNTPVVRYCKSRHSPVSGPPDNILYIRHSVQITHLGMAVKLHPLNQTVIHPLLGKVLALLYTHHRADGQLSVKLVNGGHPLQLDKASLYHCLVDIVQHFLSHKQLHGNRIRKIRHIKNKDRLSTL